MDSNKKKSLFLKALAEARGNVSHACKVVGAPRSWFYDNKNKDSEFAKQVEEIEEAILDDAEKRLQDYIHGDDNRAGITATIFFLKTRGKDRGYSERIETDNKHDHNGSVNISFNGSGVKPISSESEMLDEDERDV